MSGQDEKKPLHFGELLARLRSDRRITQGELAAASELSPATISKQERSPDCRLRPANARRCLDELDRIRTVEGDDRISFLFACRLPETPASLSSAMMSTLAGSSAAEEARRTFAKLLDDVGPDRMLAALKALSAVSEKPKPGELPPTPPTPPTPPAANPGPDQAEEVE